MARRKKFTDGVSIELFYDGQQPDEWIVYRSPAEIAAQNNRRVETMSAEERARRAEKQRQSIIDKYGSYEEYIRQRDEKSYKTKIEKYGSIEAFEQHNKEIREKTMLERYGVTHNFSKGSPSLEKRKETWLEKYGVDNPLKSADVQERSKQTCHEKYGVEHYFQTEEHKSKSEATRIEKYGSIEAAEAARVEKTKATCKERYGVEFVTQTDEFKEKAKQGKIARYGSLEEAGKQIYKKYQATMFEHYGVDNYFKSKEFFDFMTPERKVARVEASNETKRKNNTFHTSTAEEELYSLLVEKFGSEDVIRSYTDARYARQSGYMFQCDFYIKSLDLFIELNLHPTHGPHPFDSANQEDIMFLEVLQQDDSQWALNTIDVWTKLDVEKQNIAKTNKINYKVIYDRKEFEELFK